MGAPEWQRVKELVADALEQAPDERSAFLDHACGDDAALRAEVDELLAAHALAEEQDALGAPVFDGGLLADALSPTEDDEGPDPDEVVASHEERIGPYRLMELVGKGGMGAVYRAERADGVFEQEVAVKLMRRGLEHAELRQRFEQERQILARLQHEGIAHLLDGGVTDDGVPYLVMEYVQGTPITQFARDHALSTEARIQLFQQVCAAVHSAHQNLVIHRDLKPSNILVTATGRVKLLDFGIAWLVREDGEEAALTRTGVRLMTPEYAAPEQVRGEAVTTATDVYALGILLFELLTGKRPYRVQGLSPGEMERIICTTMPDRPSTLVDVTTQGPPSTARQLRGDLDNIVLKALRKEADRRYRSAVELSEDLRRHLVGLPVEARPDTLGYRWTKFAQRNRWAVAGASVVLLALITVLVSTVVQGQRVAQERDRARAEAAKAERINEFLQDMLASADPYDGNRDVTVLQVLEETSRGLETELAEEPEIQAAAHATLGETFMNLGRYEQSEHHLRRALELYGAQPIPDRGEMGEISSNVAVVLQSQGEYDEAEELFRERIEGARALYGERHERHATALSNLAVLLWERDKGLDEAEQLQREALRIDRELFGEQHEAVATDLDNLSTLLFSKGDAEAGEAMLREALGIHTSVNGPTHPSTLITMTNLAVTLASRKELAESRQMLDVVLARRREVLGETHPSIALTLGLLGQIADLEGDSAQALAHYRAALPIVRKHLVEDHPQRVAVEGRVRELEAAADP